MKLGQTGALNPITKHNYTEDSCTPAREQGLIERIGELSCILKRIESRSGSLAFLLFGPRPESDQCTQSQNSIDAMVYDLLQTAHDTEETLERIYRQLSGE